MCRMKPDERQIMAYEVDEGNAIHAGSTLARVRLFRPIMLVCCRMGINGKVQIRSQRTDVVIDVYLADKDENVIWCEKDAINPFGDGRVFQCGKDIVSVVVVCRPRGFRARFDRVAYVNVKIC